MTDSSQSIHATSGTTPLSEKQFISFEHIAGGVFSLFAALCIFVWNDHSGDFKELKQDVSAIRVIIPTLATKDEMNAKFEKMDKKMDATSEKLNAKIDAVSEKMNKKLDALILSVNTIQNTMATKEDVAANSRAIAKLDKRVTLLEKAVAK